MLFHAVFLLIRRGFTTRLLLFNFLFVDGINGWVETPQISDECITRVQCEQGISVGFWMKYQGGDYVMAAGYYVGEYTQLQK